MAAVVHDEEEEEEQQQQRSTAMVKAPTTLASIESLTFPLVHEVVLLADFRCRRCQDRVAGIVSRLNGEVESVEIIAMEKKVILTLTGRYSRPLKMPGKKLEVVTVYKNLVDKFLHAK